MKVKTNLRQEKKSNDSFSSNSHSAVNNADDSSDSFSGFVSVFYGSGRSGGFVLMVPVVPLVLFRWFCSGISGFCPCPFKVLPT